MIFKKTDIEKELSHFKNKSKTLDVLQNELQQILNSDSHQHQEGRIDTELGKSRHSAENDFSFDLLETERIYHLDQIKEICVDFRLRFLDTRHFKGTIPKSAIVEIKRLEESHKIQIKGYKIMAPSKLFKLEDRDDPLLFAPIGNGYYYLVHKWGNDLHPFRKLLVWPFKDMVNLMVLVMLISLLVTLMVPDGLFSKQSSTTEFWIIYFFMFKGIGAVTIFYGFALGKNFNPAIWNSKYFNT